jgi:quinolinate synthase
MRESILVPSSERDLTTSRVSVHSTEGMIQHVNELTSDMFLVATETGILHRMEKENPGKVFLPVKKDAVCRYMKMITLEKVYESLRAMIFEVRVPEQIATKARLGIQRMLAMV